MAKKLYFDNLYTLMRGLAFAKPYNLKFWSGTILFSSQNFVYPLLIGFLSRSAVVGISQGDTVLLIRGIIYSISILLICAFLVALGLYLALISKAKIEKDLMCNVFTRLTEQRNYFNHKYSNMMAAMNTDMTQATNIFHNSLTPLLSSVVASFFSTGALFIISPVFGGVGVVIGLLFLTLQISMAIPISKISRNVLNSKAQATGFFGSAISNNLAIRAVGFETIVATMLETDALEIKKLDIRLGFFRSLQSMFLTLGGWLSIVLTFVIGYRLVYSEQLYTATLLMVPPLLSSVIENISEIGKDWTNMQPSIEALSRVLNIINSETPNGIKKSINCFDLRVDNVSLTYPGCIKPSLSDISIDIKYGEIVAVVGKSGVGKSTLLKALAQVDILSQGRISLGGVDYNDITNLNEYITYVPQAPEIFDMSIYDNIAIGKKYNISKKDVGSIIKRMEIDNNSRVMRGGEGITSGEAQLICIARAIIKNAPILLLDEATSSLDAKLEARVMKEIEMLRGKNTVIFITHNRDNLRFADRILSLDAVTDLPV